MKLRLLFLFIVILSHQVEAVFERRLTLLDFLDPEDLKLPPSDKTIVGATSAEITREGDGIDAFNQEDAIKSETVVKSEQMSSDHTDDESDTLPEQETRQLNNRGQNLDYEIRKKIVCLKAAGLTLSQIGVVLSLKPRTVSSNYYRKKDEIICSPVDVEEYFAMASHAWASLGKGELKPQDRTREKRTDKDLRRKEHRHEALLPDLIKREIVCLVESGMMKRKIAERLGVTVNQVKNVAKKYSGSFECEEIEIDAKDRKRADKMTGTDKRKAVCLYKAGLSIRDISRIYDWNESVVKRHCYLLKETLRCNKREMNAYLSETLDLDPSITLSKTIS